MDEALTVVIDHLTELESALESRARRLDQDYRAACLLVPLDQKLTDEQLNLYYSRNELWDVSHQVIGEAKDLLIKAKKKGMLSGDVAEVVTKIERGEIRH